VNAQQEEHLHRLLSVCDLLSPEERDAITHAYTLAARVHAGAMRRSGEPFIEHPLTVALIVAQIGLDAEVICAALLHDVVEDAGYPLEALRAQFGASVAHLVDAVTVPEAEVLPRYQLHSIATHKLLQAMETNRRAGWLKLADRLHNLRTLAPLRPDEQRMIALETLTFYVPLAHHLGAVTIRGELERLAQEGLSETLMEAGSADERSDPLLFQEQEPEIRAIPVVYAQRSAT
jgi:guanosine-3',5'-bis(diphosphate) 3'-pyrophosphohydrolase